jgi:uncharacterized iron-regulated membrane protein
MLLVLAWSGVAFNLSEVYRPVMGLVFDHQPLVIPKLDKRQLTPIIGWSEARDIGRQLISEQAELQGFSVDYERRLTYSPKTGSYRYDVRSSRDINDHKGSTRLAFNATTGELIGLWLPTGAAAGDTIRSWLVNIHMASFWGCPFKLFICLVGLAVAMLSVTGVTI